MPHPKDEHEPRSWFETKVSSWFWSLTPTCREVVRLTSEEREHPLPWGMRWRLRLHRLFCKWCARYARQLDLLHEASQLFPEKDQFTNQPVLKSEVEERLKRAVREQVQSDS